jgi:hypothetical protein
MRKLSFFKLALPFLLLAQWCTETAFARAQYLQFGEVSCVYYLGQLSNCKDAQGKAVPVPADAMKQIEKEQAAARKKNEEALEKRCAERKNIPPPVFPKSALCQGNGGLPAKPNEHFQQQLKAHYAVLRNKALAEQDPALFEAAQASLIGSNQEQGTDRRITPEEISRKAKKSGGFVAHAEHAKKLIASLCAEKKVVEEKINNLKNEFAAGGETENLPKEAAAMFRQMADATKAYKKEVEKKYSEWDGLVWPKLQHLQGILGKSEGPAETQSLREQLQREMQANWNLRGPALKPFSVPIEKESDLYSEFQANTKALAFEVEECIPKDMKSLNP